MCAGKVVVVFVFVCICPIPIGIIENYPFSPPCACWQAQHPKTNVRRHLRSPSVCVPEGLLSLRPSPTHPAHRFGETDFKILTEATKTPPRAVALASFLGDSYAAIGARAPPAKDLMAFGSVLQHNQHNIGAYWDNRYVTFFKLILCKLLVDLLFLWTNIDLKVLFCSFFRVCVAAFSILCSNYKKKKLYLNLLS